MKNQGPLQLYGFSYFMGEGAEGMYIAVSPDGKKWTPLADGKPVFYAGAGGENLMRDPFIIADAEGKGFHAIWTTGWSGKSLGYAFSENLKDWHSARSFPVMEHEADARNAWAPEATIDPLTGEYLVYFATRIPSKFEGHRMFFVRTRDFQSLSAPELLLDPGYSVIDAHIIEIEKGSRYHMIVKDEREGFKCLRKSHAAHPAGPWEMPSEPISGTKIEGATSVRLDEGWLVLADNYGAHCYEAYLTTDFENRTDISDQLTWPGRVRHGTLFMITGALAESLHSELVSDC